MEHYSLVNALTEILKVEVQDLADEVVVKNDMEGLPRWYLEKEVSSLANKKDWDAFMDVLALIYVVVLFPNIDDFIDYTTIDSFLAFKDRQESPVSAILTDVYYALHLHHEKKGGVATVIPT